MKKCVLPILVFAFCGRTASAADPIGVQFPDADNSHDLSSAAAWVGSVVTDPTAASSYKIQLVRSYNYLVLKDIYFNQLDWEPWGYQPTIDCTSAPSVPTVKLASGIYVDGYESNVLTLKGGRWDLCVGKIQFDTTKTAKSGRTLVIDAAAVVTNVGSISVMDSKGGSTGQHLKITGGSKVYDAGYFYVGFKGEDSSLTVDGGSELQLANGSFATLSYGETGSVYEGTGRANLSVSGVGSLIVINETEPKKGVFTVGDGTLPAVLSVKDGARMEISAYETKVGCYAYSHLNLVHVGGGGCLCTKLLQLGRVAFTRGLGSAQDASNRLEVVDGGVYSNVTHLTINNCGNTMVVSNALANVRMLTVGGTDNAIVLQGRTPKFNLDCEVASYASSVGGSGRLRFELPEEGYPSGYCPFESNCDLTFAEGTGIDIVGAAEMARHLTAVGVVKADYDLIRCSLGTLTIPQSVLDATSSDLPKGFKLVADSQRLRLKYSGGGMAIFLR